MTLAPKIVKEIVKKLLAGKDYRIVIINQINTEFLKFAIEFFKKVVNAKLNDEQITINWYKNYFLNPSLPKNEIAINAGLNMKSIENMYNTTRKKIVIEASNVHFETLYNSIEELIQLDDDINLTLTIRFKGVSVDLNVSESLIIINTLAVKRSALRGGSWSTVGKRVEKPLMLTLCKLYNVSSDNYDVEYKNPEEDQDFTREIDFYLLKQKNRYKCEVKLMGKGNPESADAVIARDSKVFIADKLSLTNKSQLDSLQVEWVELRNENGFKKFEIVLSNLEIPHLTLDEVNLEENIDTILDEILL